MAQSPLLKRNIFLYRPNYGTSLNNNGKPVNRIKKRKILLAIALSLTLLSTTVPSSGSAETIHQSSLSNQNISSSFNKLVDYPSYIPENNPHIYANNYILMDDSSASILLENNINDSIPIASLTKMTTAIVVAREMPLDKVVEVRQSVANVPGSRINLYTGEKITVLNLLKGLLIQSGNDAAFALAQAYSNSDDTQPFVDKMNSLVKEMGLNKTNYNDPAGLDDDNGHSTAFEQAQIARLLLRTKPLDEIVSIPKTTIYSEDGNISHDLTNSNRLIRPDEALYIPGVVGIKTGYTNNAGHCLIAAYKINNRTYIGAIFNTTVYTNSASAEEMYKLLNWSKQIEFSSFF